MKTRFPLRFASVLILVVILFPLLPRPSLAESIPPGATSLGGALALRAGEFAAAVEEKAAPRNETGDFSVPFPPAAEASAPAASSPGYAPPERPSAAQRWTPLESLPETPEMVTVPSCMYEGADPALGYVFAAVPGDIAVARWDGEKWEEKNQNLAGSALNVNRIAVNPFTVTNILIATGNAGGGGVYSTTDALESCEWHSVTFSINPTRYLVTPTHSIAANPINRGVFYAGTQFNLSEGNLYCYKTANGGKSWVRHFLSSNNPDKANDIAVSTVDGMVVYVANAGGTTSWKSTDGGDSFEAMYIGKKAMACDVEPGSDTIVYIANDDTYEYHLAKSTDGGGSWTDIRPCPGVGYKDVAVSPYDRRVWASQGVKPGQCQWAIVWSDDRGDHWTSLEIGFIPTDIGFGLPGEIWVSGEGKEILVSTDNGITWREEDIPNLETAANIVDIAPLGRYWYLPADQTWGPCTECNNYEGGPVNTYSGNYTYSEEDLSLPTLGIPLRFFRTYNAHSVELYTDTLGYGWRHNWQMRLVLEDDAGGEDNRIIFENHTGARMRFSVITTTTSTTYVPFPGVYAELTATESAGVYTYTMTTTEELQYVFNDAGQLRYLVDPQGYTTTFSYNGQGRLEKVEDFSGNRYLELEYNAQDLLEKVSDPLARAVEYGYDANNDLVAITGTRGFATAIEYVSNTHLLKKIVDPNGHTVEENAYDARARVVAQADGLSNITTFEYDGHMSLTLFVTTTDPLGNASVDRYYHGLLGGQEDALGESSARSYDHYLNPTHAIDEKGNKTLYQGNEWGLTEAITDALGNDTFLDYDGQKLTEYTDARGNSTRYAYSGDNLISTTNALHYTTLFTYSDGTGGIPANLLLETEDPRGKITSYGYDSYGQMLRMATCGGQECLTTTHSYDGAGRLISTTVAPGTNLARTTVYFYNRANQITKTVENCTAADRAACESVAFDPGQPDENIIIAYGYDKVGNRTHVTRTVGASDWIVTFYEYNAANRLVRVVENYQDGVYNPGAPDEDVSTRYAYDAAGRQVLTSNALGVRTTTAYDAAGRPTATTQNYDPSIDEPSVYIDSDPGGPGGYYYWLDPAEATTHTITSGSSHISIALPGGKTFTHYGDAYSSIWATRYGYLYFGVEHLSAVSYSTAGYCNFPHSDGWDNIVAPLWCDGQSGYPLTLRSWETTDPFSGDDLFVIEYVNLYASGTATQTERFQVVLNLERNSILFQYHDFNAAGQPLGVGIEDSIGGEGVAYYHGNPGQPAQNEPHAQLAVLFTRPQSAEGNVSSYYGYDRVGNRTQAVETLLSGGEWGLNEGGEPELGLPPGLPEPPATLEPPTLEAPFQAFLPLVAKGWPAPALANQPPAGVAAAPLRQEPPGQDIVRERGSYRASFGREGLRYEPKTRLVETADYHLDFRLTQVKSGQSKLFHPGSPQNPPVAPRGREDRVNYDRGQVFSEEYLLTDSGLEQRFVFEQRFALDGDLEIEGNLTGNLRPTLNEASGEIQLLTPSGEAVASYGRAIVVDAVGRQMVAALELKGAHLRIVVPEQWLAEAVYPVVVDPLIGSNFAVTTQAISGLQERPAVASAGDGQYLVAWYGDGSGDDVFAQMVSAEGALISETIPVDSRSGNQRYPDVAANISDTEYLVVYQHYDFSFYGWDIYARRVSSDGARLGAPIEIYKGRYHQQYPAATYNVSNNQYLVVWESYDSRERVYGIYGQLVDSDGSLVDETITIATSESALAYPDVTFNLRDTQYLVVWQESSEKTGWDIWGRVVESDGSMEEAAFAISEDALDQSVPAATYSISDTEYLVVWQSYTGSSNDVHARRVSSGGSLLGERIGVATSSDDQCAPAASYGDDLGQYLVSWEHYPHAGIGPSWDLYGQRIAGDGSPAGSAITIYYDVSYGQRYPAVAYDDQSEQYLAVWQDYRSGSSWDIYGQRVEPDGDLVGQDFLLSAELAGYIQDQAAVAYGSEQELYLVVWSDTLDDPGTKDLYGQLVSGGGMLVGERFTISVATNFDEIAPAVAYDPDHDEFLVVWQRFQAEEAVKDICAQRVDGDGDLVGTPMIVCNRAGAQENPAVSYNGNLGYFLVVWEDNRDSWDVYARAVEAGSGEMEDEFVVQDDRYDLLHHADVVANELAGEFLVVWQRDDEEEQADICGRRAGVTQANGSAFEIAASEEHNEMNPGVTFSLSDTTYLAVWEYDSGGSLDIRGRRIAPGGTLLGSELVIAAGEGERQYPDVAWDEADGSYAVAWQNEADLLGTILDYAGVEMGSGEETLSSAGNSQLYPAIAYDSTRHRFLAVWDDYRHSTTEPDVYGQLYRGYSLVVDYTYDPLYRLVEARYSDGDYYGYQYDAVGNRIAYTDTAGVTTVYAHDDADRLITVTRAGVETIYSWSDRGELLSDGGQTYTWNAAGQLITVTGDVVAGYRYSGDGSRVSSEVDGTLTRYLVDPFSPIDRVPQVLVERAGGERTRYLYGLDLLGQIQGGTPTYLGYDALSVRLHVNNSGEIEATYRYGPFGETVGEGVSGYGFSGEKFDAEPGLLYLRARYYAPAVGRFVSRDMWAGRYQQPQTLNRFVYVTNDPVNGYDPTGHYDLLEMYGRDSRGENGMFPNIVNPIPFSVHIGSNGSIQILQGGNVFVNDVEIALANALLTGNLRYLDVITERDAKSLVVESLNDALRGLGVPAGGTLESVWAMVLFGVGMMAEKDEGGICNPTSGWGSGRMPASERMWNVQTVWDMAAEDAARAAEAAAKNLLNPGSVDGIPQYDNANALSRNSDWRIGTRTVGEAVGDTEIKPGIQNAVDELYVEQFARSMLEGSFNWDNMRNPMEFARLPDGSLVVMEGHHRFVAAQMTNTPIPWNNPNAVIIHDLPSWPSSDWGNYRWE